MIPRTKKNGIGYHAVDVSPSLPRMNEQTGEDYKVNRNIKMNAPRKHKWISA
jgi:hypothetical protein